MNADIIERLKEVFEEAGLNISQVSEKTGIAQPNISKMLNGKRAIGVNMIERFSKSFDISWLSIFLPYLRLYTERSAKEQKQSCFYQ